MSTNKDNNTAEETTDIVSKNAQNDAATIMAGNANMVSTLTTATLEDTVTVYNALNSAVSLAQVDDATIDVVNIILVPGVRKGRNGQPDSECVNVYLIDSSDNAYFTQSDGIARSAQQLITMFFMNGMVTKDNPICVKVIERKLVNGNTIKSLAIDM